MTELNKKILELVEINASVNKISEITGLTNKQLFYRLSLLKNQGYNLKRKYYYNGDIAYKLIHNLNYPTTNNNIVSILTSKDDTEFKAILISDLHVSNLNERLDLLNILYNYCIKEGIHIIINAGDIIDGLLGSSIKKFQTYENQIEYLLKVYPFDKSILNFVCLGNHDYDSVHKSGLDLMNILNNKRHDLVTLGYQQGTIGIKNDHIHVCHYIPSFPSIPVINNPLIIRGHTHEMKYEINEDNNIFINVPSLCDIPMNNSPVVPGAIKMTLTFKKGFFDTGYFEHLLFLQNNVCKVSESKFDLGKGKNNSIDLNENIEERKPIIKNEENEKKLTLQKSSKTNQIDKFKARYGIN